MLKREREREREKKKHNLFITIANKLQRDGVKTDSHLIGNGILCGGVTIRPSCPFPYSLAVRPLEKRVFVQMYT